MDAEARAVTFTAPGDNWYAGRVETYRAIADDGEARDLAANVVAGETESLNIPGDMDRFTLRAVDDAGNLGRPVRVSMAGSSVTDAVGTAGSARGGADGGGGSGSGGCVLGDGDDAELPLLLLLALALFAGRCRIQTRSARR